MINRILMELYDEYEKENINAINEFATKTFKDEEVRNLFIGCFTILAKENGGFKPRYNCNREKLLEIVKMLRDKETTILYIERINDKKGIKKYFNNYLDGKVSNNQIETLIDYLEQFKPDFYNYVLKRKSKIKGRNKKILIICSKKFYSKIEEIKKELTSKDIDVYLPNCYENPETEEKMWNLGREEHQKFKSKMFKKSEETIANMDAVLVLNFDKETNDEILKNYIGGATFLEMYDAFRLNKKIYLYNNIPDSILYDEIQGFNPIIINGNLDKIKE